MRNNKALTKLGFGVCGELLRNAFYVASLNYITPLNHARTHAPMRACMHAPNAIAGTHAHTNTHIHVNVNVRS